LRIEPRVLSEVFKDSEDVQVVDLRHSDPGRYTQAGYPFPRALRLLPHQIDAEPSPLSKQRWTILIDDGNRVAEPIAERLFQRGYLLIAVLDGGYPAWARTTDR
jgi:rhodanese-related sulfurtransferase